MPSDNASQKNSEQNYMSYEEYLQKVKTGILTDSGNCPVTPLLKMLQGKWYTSRSSIWSSTCIFTVNNIRCDSKN